MTRPAQIAPAGQGDDRGDSLPHARHRRRLSSFRVTERDRELLRFVAAHRFVLERHVRTWLGTGRTVCYRRLRQLTGHGLLAYVRIFHAQPGCFKATYGGLAIADSDLALAKIDLRTYGHDAMLVWLWLQVRAGAFGPVRALMTEREMRSHDERDPVIANPYGLQLIGVGDRGRPRRHYPDLLLDTGDGARIAIELELTLKSRRRLQSIVAGYGGHPGLKTVLYFTNSRAVERALRETAAAVAREDLVQVERVPQNLASPGSWSSHPGMRVTASGTA